MTNSDIEHMAQGYPPAHIGKDHEELVIYLAKKVIQLQRERDALAAENAALKSAISYVRDTQNQPDYQYDGMGCGIEDRGIVDRYEAARYGWDEAMDRMYSEVIHYASDIATPATDAFMNSVRAEGIDILTGGLQQLIDEGVFDAKEIGVAAGAVHEGHQMAAHLRATAPKGDSNAE